MTAKRPTPARRSPPARASQGTARTARSGSKAGSRGAEEGQRAASRAADEAQAVASTAQEQARQVGNVAARQAREMGATAKEQAERVRGDVVEQGRAVVAQARVRIEAQAHEQTRQLADRVARLGDEARALSQGRPEDAEVLAPYLSNATDALYEAADRVYALAAAIEERGPTGVLEDVQAFARRRPGSFLVGAAVAGFGLGRAVRASSSDDAESTSPRERRTR